MSDPGLHAGDLELVSSGATSGFARHGRAVEAALMQAARLTGGRLVYLGRNFERVVLQVAHRDVIITMDRVIRPDTELYRPRMRACFHSLGAPQIDMTRHAPEEIVDLWPRFRLSTTDPNTTGQLLERHPVEELLGRAGGDRLCLKRHEQTTPYGETISSGLLYCTLAAPYIDPQAVATLVGLFRLILDWNRDLQEARLGVEARAVAVLRDRGEKVVDGGVLYWDPATARCRAIDYLRSSGDVNSTAEIAAAAFDADHRVATSARRALAGQGIAEEVDSLRNTLMPYLAQGSPRARRLWGILQPRLRALFALPPSTEIGPAAEAVLAGVEVILSLLEQINELQKEVEDLRGSRLPVPLCENDT